MVGGAGGVGAVGTATAGRGSDAMRDKESFGLSLGEGGTSTGFDITPGRDNGSEGGRCGKGNSNSKKLI